MVGSDRLNVPAIDNSEGGGGPLPPPWLTQTLGVGGSGGRPPGPPGGGVGGYPNINTSK